MILGGWSSLTGQAAEGIEKYGFEPLIPTIFDPTVYLVHSVLILFITILISVYPIRYIYMGKGNKKKKIQSLMRREFVDPIFFLSQSYQ